MIVNMQKSPQLYNCDTTHMGLFHFLFKGIRSTSKYGLYLGGIYTFFGFFYAQEIKYRLGDEQHCHKKEVQSFLRQLNIQNVSKDDYPVELAMKIMNIYTFYMRTWLFREFEQDCKEFHKHVITSIIKNYEEYGILKHREEMEQHIKKNQVSPAILSRIMQVKELNIQLISLYGQKYFSIIKNQVNLRTGAILGMTEEERAAIDLISAYIEKGEKLIFKNEEKYWEYKLMQSEARKHSYGDTIFKIIFI